MLLWSLFALNDVIFIRANKNSADATFSSENSKYIYSSIKCLQLNAMSAHNFMKYSRHMLRTVVIGQTNGTFMISSSECSIKHRMFKVLLNEDSKAIQRINYVDFFAIARKKSVQWNFASVRRLLEKRSDQNHHVWCSTMEVELQKSIFNGDCCCHVPWSFAASLIGVVFDFDCVHSHYWWRRLCGSSHHFRWRSFIHTDSIAIVVWNY